MRLGEHRLNVGLARQAVRKGKPFNVVDEHVKLGEKLCWASQGDGHGNSPPPRH